MSDDRDIEQLDFSILQCRPIGTTAIGAKTPKTENLFGCFLAASNQYGFTLIGKNDSFLFVKTQTLVDLSKDGKKDTSVFQRILVPSGTYIHITIISRRFHFRTRI
jgi:hypothetical protein